MKLSIVGLALVVLWQGVSLGASRTWKSRKGIEVKAEFTGVVDGKAILKLPGNIRQAVRLSDFSLEDRDFLVKELTKRNRKKDMEQLLQMMALENTVRPIDPDKAPTTGNSDPGAETVNYDPMGFGVSNPLPGAPGIPGNPNLPNAGNGQQQPVVETEMYGLPLPSPELLVEEPVRSWTSLVGHTQLARLDRVLAPGVFRLKKTDGSTGDFAIVNFSKEDIDYVKKALQKDMARPVFPEGSGFQSLTSDDVSKGYRVWTDRKKVPLVGKFVAVKGKDVVIEVNGEEKEYPKAGLSDADRNWVDGEIRRRAEEAAARARAAAESSGGHSYGGTSTFPRRPTFPTRPSFPSRPTFTRPSFGGGSPAGGHAESGMEEFADAGMPEEQPHQGGHFGGSRGPSSLFVREFTCPKCGYKWTRDDGTIMDVCPQCSSGQSQPKESSSGSGWSPTRTTESSVSGGKDRHGVAMTIIYVITGLGVLAGIATGLIRSFG